MFEIIILLSKQLASFPGPCAAFHHL